MIKSKKFFTLSKDLSIDLPSVNTIKFDDFDKPVQKAPIHHSSPISSERDSKQTAEDINLTKEAISNKLSGFFGVSCKILPLYSDVYEIVFPSSKPSCDILKQYAEQLLSTGLTISAKPAEELMSGYETSASLEIRSDSLKSILASLDNVSSTSFTL